MLDLPRDLELRVSKKLDLLYSQIVAEKEKNHFSFQTSNLDVSSDSIRIGKSGDLSSSQLQEVTTLLKSLNPWRKGPWDFFGIELDTEWNSSLKWNRIKSYIGSLSEKRICDIGANNGYYMFKMLEENPRFIVGLEPSSKVLFQYFLILSFLKPEVLEGLPLQMIPYGFDFLDYLNSSFDVIFCLGFLYHHQDPCSILQKIYKSLDKKGLCIIETMGIGGEEPIALFPGVTYHGSRGFWFIPTESCLLAWLRKCNFQNIEVFYNEPLLANEQFKTDWSPYPSFEDGIKIEQDKKVTVEGYPLQRRMYVSCTR